MENCLVTKLKSSVNNNTLPHFGYVGILLSSEQTGEVWSVDDFKITVFQGKIRLFGDAHFVKNGSSLGKETDVTNPTIVFDEPGDVLLEIPYSGIRGNFTLMNTQYSGLIGTIEDIDVDSLMLSVGRLDHLYINPTTLSGNIESVSNKVIGNIQIRQADPSLSYIKGCIDNIEMSNMGACYSYSFVNLLNVTGSLNTFLDHLAAATIDGYTQNNCSILVENCPNILYNGEPCVYVLFKINIANKQWSVVQ